MDNLEKTILAVLLPAMAVLMLAAAFCRHLLPQYHPPVLTAAAFCLTWIVAVGMARAAALGLHARVPAAADVAGGNTRRRLAVLADAAFLLFAALTFIIGCAATVAAVRHPAPPGHPLVFAAIPVGSVLTIIRLVERLRQPAEGTRE